MSLFWVLFPLSWVFYAAFVGFTGFLLQRARGLHLLPYLGVSALIVFFTVAELIDQNALEWLRGLMYWLNMAAMTLLLAAWIMSWRLPGRLARIGRSLAVLTFAISVLWSLGMGLFLPLLFFPNREILAAHLLFAALFLLVSAATFFLMKRVRVEKAVALEATPALKTGARPFRPLRLGVTIALAVLLLFWLAQWSIPRAHGGLLNSNGERGMSPAMLDDTEILCSGHFSRNWQPFRYCWGAQLSVGEAGYERPVRVQRKIVPFLVDHYWKGSGSREIDIAVFEPSERYWGNSWQLPAQENLLVALKKDTTGTDACQFVNQGNSWLVIAPGADVPATDSSPADVIKANVFDYLQRYAAGSEARRQVLLQDPLTIDSLAGLTKTIEVNNLTVLRQAMGTVRNFQMEDEKTIALLKQMFAAPEPDNRDEKPKGMVMMTWTSGAPVRQEVLAALLKLSPDNADLMTWLKNYNARPIPAAAKPGQFAMIGGDEYSNFPEELETAVANSGDLQKMMPLISEALASPNPRMRQSIAQALRQRQEKDNGGYNRGNQLGNQFFPPLVKLLDDPDLDVQHAAMGCIFFMSGEIRKRPAERELNIWATSIYKQNPALFPTQLAQNKAWWAQQKQKIDMTQAVLDQLHQGLVDYAKENGRLPSVTDPRELVQILQRPGPNNTAPPLFSGAWKLDQNSEPVDGWGQRLRINLADPKNPVVQSAGLDKRWGTADDLWSGQAP